MRKSARTGNYRVVMMHHPSHHALDLPEAERWFQRVFGRPSISIGTILASSPVAPGFPRDYSIYTPVSDVLFDTIDPKRFVIDGVQKYASIDEPHLKDFGWYVEGMPELYREFQQRGIRVTSTQGELLDAPEIPTGPNGLAAPMHTVREDTGVRCQFYPSAMEFPIDPRKSPDFVVGRVADDDPLGIACASHHTILTADSARAERFIGEILGGEVIHRGHDDVRGATSTLFHLAGSILEYGEPDEGTPAHADLATTLPNDCYHAITWRVADLNRAERHLSAEGVRIRSRSIDTLVTDPVTSLGIPWGFTTKAVPGDPRRVG
jgi:catechol 2,3-dioxygenase-like lactoylglutathione lyase family enzyme